MTQTLTRLYDSYDTALRAALALKESGFTDRELSVVAQAPQTTRDSPSMDIVTEDAGTGASLGGAIGAAAGLMAGMGVLAIPGIGPVVAAGWLASTLAVGAAGVIAGGATGGIVGALAGSGTSEDDANIYAEGVRRGDSLVTVRVPDDRVSEAARILSEYPAVITAERVEVWRDEGWERFDATAAPYRREADEPVLPAGLPETRSPEPRRG